MLCDIIMGPGVAENMYEKGNLFHVRLATTMYPEQRKFGVMMGYNSYSNVPSNAGVGFHRP